MEITLLAVGLDKSRKLEVLERANSKFDALKILLRMARELKMIDNKRYLSLQKNASYRKDA